MTKTLMWDRLVSGRALEQRSFAEGLRGARFHARARAVRAEDLIDPQQRREAMFGMTSKTMGAGERLAQLVAAGRADREILARRLAALARKLVAADSLNSDEEGELTALIAGGFTSKGELEAKVAILEKFTRLVGEAAALQRKAARAAAAAKHAPERIPALRAELIELQQAQHMCGQLAAGVESAVRELARLVSEAPELFAPDTNPRQLVEEAAKK
jgi:hypothetical protein